MSVTFKSAPFKTTGGITARSLDNWFGDRVNVKEMGALGNNTADDTIPIQNAFNLAFGSPANGYTNRHLNRPVYFPAGRYKITNNINLTKVVGGHIYGAGKQSTQIIWAGAIAGVTGGVFTPMLTLNGCSDLCIERLMLYMPNGGAGGDNTCALFIDWDGDNSGNGCSGSHDNHFQEMSIGAAQYSVVIGRAGAATSQGYNNLFVNCTVGGDFGRTQVAYDIRGPSADHNQMIGGGGTECSVAWARCPAGGGSLMAQGTATGGNGNRPDFIMASGKVMHISQVRSENIRLLKMDSGVVTLQACSGATGTIEAVEINGGICNVEGCSFQDLGQIIGTGGKLLLWGTNFGTSVTPLSGYSGTVTFNPGCNLTVYVDATLADFYIDEATVPVSAFTDDTGEPVIIADDAPTGPSERVFTIHFL